MSQHDQTFTCSHEPCSCRVADDATHVKDDAGGVYCSPACRDGKGCDHSACDCSGGR